MKENNNARVYAQKNEKGFISLFLELGDINTKIEIVDFNGTQKQRARKLTYKIFKTLEDKKNG